MSVVKISDNFEYFVMCFIFHYSYGLTSYHHYTASLSMADKLSCLGLLENDKPGDTLPSLDVCNSTCFLVYSYAAHNFATLPVSTATAERSFSVTVLKVLKSNLRSRTGEECLSHRLTFTATRWTIEASKMMW